MNRDYIPTPEEIRDTIACIDEHWIPHIREPLARGDTTYRTSPFAPLRWQSSAEYVKCKAEDCILCHKYQDPSFTCNNCPLKKRHGHSCNDGAWKQFMDNPCLETCDAMIQALRDILPPEKKAEGEIVEKAKQFGRVTSYRDNFLAPFRAIQAEIDKLKLGVDAALSGIDHLEKANNLLAKLPDKKPDLATDKNGHDLRWPDIISWRKIVDTNKIKAGEKEYGIFSHAKDGRIYAYWQNGDTGGFEHELDSLDSSHVTFEFRPERDC